MASPLSIFRKYQYLLLVGFGIMLMFAFVIAPPLDSYLRNHAGVGPGANAVVVEWKYGKIHETELASMRTAHLLTLRFLQTLVARIEVQEPVKVELQGQTVQLIKGRSYPYAGEGRDAENNPTFQIMVGKQVVDVPQSAAEPVRPKASMIPRASSEEELVQKVLLAKRAEQMGIVISDEAILDYFDKLCDATPNQRPDYLALLDQSTKGRMNIRQLMAQMAFELSAQRMLMMSQSGLYALPPEELYQCFNRVNRRVTAEFLPVDVVGFVDQTPQPTDGDVRALYEKSKDRFPNPNSPDPGFKRRKRIAFGYTLAEVKTYLDEETAKVRGDITDEEIEKYYQDNKETEFKIPELPPAESAPDKTAPDKTAPPQPEPPDAGAGTAAPDMPAKPAPPAAGGAPEKPAASEKPAEPEKAGEVPAKPEGDPGVPPADPVPSSDPPSGPAPAGDPPSAARLSRDDGLVRLVSFQDESAAEPAPAPAPAPKAEPAAGPEVTPPAEPAPETTPPVGASGEAPAAPQPAAKPATNTAAQGASEPAAKTDVPAKAKYRPLDDERREEIRDRLAERKARPIAEKRMEDALGAVRRSVEDYARQLVRAKLLDTVEKPAPLDLTPLVAENKLQQGQTLLLDVVEVVEIQQAEPAEDDPGFYAFLRATETAFDQQAGMVRRTIAELGFSGDLALYTPRRLVDGFVSQSFPIPPERAYLYWRMEEDPERVPPLDEVRDSVVAAWRLRQAVPLAQKHADQLAEEARKAGKPLAEVLPGQAAKLIKTGEFSWMSRGSTPMGGGGRPMLSVIRGTVGERPVTLEHVGEAFMESVFALQAGDVGTAMNSPETVIYVARVDKEVMPDSQRRELFFASGVTSDVLVVVQDEQARLIRDWYDDLESQFQVKWLREMSAPWGQSE